MCPGPYSRAQAAQQGETPRPGRAPWDWPEPLIWLAWAAFALICLALLIAAVYLGGQSSPPRCPAGCTPAGAFLSKPSPRPSRRRASGLILASVAADLRVGVH